jgi:hypothetical protein
VPGAIHFKIPQEMIVEDDYVPQQPDEPEEGPGEREGPREGPPRPIQNVPPEIERGIEELERQQEGAPTGEPRADDGPGEAAKDPFDKIVEPVGGDDQRPEEEPKEPDIREDYPELQGDPDAEPEPGFEGEFEHFKQVPANPAGTFRNRGHLPHGRR